MLIRFHKTAGAKKEQGAQKRVIDGFLTCSEKQRVIYSSIRTDTVGLMCEQHVLLLKSATNLFHDVSVRWDFSQEFIFKTGVELVGIVNIVVKGEGLEFL